MTSKKFLSHLNAIKGQYFAAHRLFKNGINLKQQKTIQIANCPNVNENHGTINNEVDFTINAFDMLDEGQYFITSCYY